MGPCILVSMLTKSSPPSIGRVWSRVDRSPQLVGTDPVGKVLKRRVTCVQWSPTCRSNSSLAQQTAGEIIFQKQWGSKSLTIFELLFFTSRSGYNLVKKSKFYFIKTIYLMIVFFLDFFSFLQYFFLILSYQFKRIMV